MGLLGWGLTKATELRHGLVWREEISIFFLLEPSFIANSDAVLGVVLALAELEVQN